MTWSPDVAFISHSEKFSRGFATGVSCRKRTLPHPETWSSSIWDLNDYVLIDYTILTKVFSLYGTSILLQPGADPEPPLPGGTSEQ